MSLEKLQNGRYQLLRLIGQGAMGKVYLAEDTRINRQVAIKVINPYAGDEATKNAVRLFHREAQTIAKLNHPHILPLFDFEEASSDGSTPTYMVMPFCPEGSFAEWLRQHKDQGLLAPQDVVQLGHQAADALQYAHDHGIIHRDVKPANFLLRSNRDHPNCPDLLLADFGVAKLSTVATRSSQMPNPYPPHRGTLVLDDPLHDNSKGDMWDITSTAGAGSCGFMNNAYHVTQDSVLGGITGCNPEALSPLSDFTLQVQMTLVSGDAGGITFRVTHTNFYLFAITPDGSYHFDVENGTSLSLPTVVRQGKNSAIHKGLNRSNLIAIVAIGKNFNLYVNNQLIDTVTDGTYGSGQIGLAAEESSNATDVMFSNAMVWKL